jgi:hypothetical protein
MLATIAIKSNGVYLNLSKLKVCAVSTNCKEVIEFQVVDPSGHVVHSWRAAHPAFQYVEVCDPEDLFRLAAE